MTLFCGRLIGWLIIFIGIVKISLPFILPITIDDVWVEKFVGHYFQRVNIGSVHIVLNEGRLSLLLQNVDTPDDEHQGLHVTRAFVSPSPVRSLLSRKWVFNKIKLYNGELNFGFGKDHIRLGAVKIPIHPDQPLPIWVHHLNLKNIKVHLDEIPEISEVYIHEVHLLNPKRQGQLKAWITEDISKRASLKVLFDFEKNYDDISGDLYVKGYDHKLIRLFNLLDWPGSRVEGKANFEFWSRVEHGQIASAVLDLEGHDLHLTKDQGLLRIDEMKGRLGYDWFNGQHRWVGENLTLKLDDRVHNTEFKLVSPDKRKYELKGKNFDIGLIHFIVKDIPQVETFFQSFDLLPTGNIPYVKMVFEDDDVKPKSVLMEAEDLAFKQNELSLNGLHGQLHYENNFITTQLKGDCATLSYPSVFDNPLKLEQYDIQANYDLQRAHIALQANAMQNNQAILGDMHLLLGASPVIGFNFKAPSLAVKTVKTLLPMRKFKPNLRHWLDKSLLDGQLQTLSFSYFGKIEDFIDPNNDHPFKLSADIKDAQLDYVANWPQLNHLTGKLLLENHGLEIQGHGKLDNAKVHQVRAKISDMRPTPTILDVSANFEADLGYGWQVIHEAGLIKTDTYENLSLQAPMTLDLALTIPLTSDDKAKTKVNGSFKFDNGTVKTSSIPYQVEKVKGELKFDNDRVISKKLTGELFDNPFKSTLSIDFSKARSLALLLDGELKQSPWLPEYIKGKAPVHAKLDWPFDGDAATLAVDFNLDKVSMALPEPLFKEKDQPQNISVLVNIKPETSIDVEAQMNEFGLQVRYDKINGEYRPQAGVLQLGKLNGHHPPENGLLVTGVLDTVDVTQWKSLIGDWQPNHHHKQDVLFDLNIEDLITQSTYLKNVDIAGSYKAQENTLTLDVDSPKLEGQFYFDLADNGPWRFNIQHLYLEKKPTKKPSFDMPLRPIQISVDEFENATARINDFNLNLIPKEDGFIINDLSFKTDKSNVDVTGVWRNQIQPHHVKLTGNIQTRNIQHLLASFDKQSSIRDAKGNIRFDLAYKGGLFKPDLASLRGHGEVSLEQGYIHGVNPGVGRVLSLLNLDTIQRRLRLDFSDVTKEGYAFDTLEGRFVLGHGKIKTDNLKLNAPTAKIEFLGDIGLISEQIRAEITVMPNVTGSLPLAAAIAAGNPAVGAAVWLMDKVVGRKIQEMTRYNYVLSGSLDSPNLQEVSDRKNSTYGQR